MTLQAEPALNLHPFEDKLIYLETPFDPPGDPRSLYADYAQARASTPVQVIERFGPDNPPLVFIYRQADNLAVLQNNEIFSSKILQSLLACMGDYLLVGMDEPEHGAYRKLLSPSFRPKILAHWEKTLIHAVADQLIEAMAPRGCGDLVSDFNFSFPAQVIARIVGLPQGNYAQFQRWAIDIVGAAADPEAGMASAKQLRAYLAGFIAARRESPQDDIISELIHTELDGERLCEEEIYSFLLLLLPAGIETTYRSLGNLMFRLLTHPDQLDAVRRDRTLVSAAIEESLRTDPPVQYPPRCAVRDINIGGITIPEGAIVLPLLGAANRDPEFIDDPDRFNIHRPNIRHMTFGKGVHTCLGLHLAKMEIGIALNKLLDRLPNLRLDSDRAHEIDAHIRGKSFRSPTAVPARWDI